MYLSYNVSLDSEGLKAKYREEIQCLTTASVLDFD